MEQHQNPVKAVAKCMRRLYKKGLTTALGGNISLKMNGFIYITPSQTDKATIKAKDICVVDENGLNLTPHNCLSMETGMHLSIYKSQKQATAIIHAHPVYATAFAAAHQMINTHLTGEAYAVIGNPVFAPYALAGSTELAASVAKASLYGSVILLQNHGILAYGSSLLDALEKIEVLENTAKMQIVGLLLQKMNPLSEENRTEIDLLRKR